MSSDDKGKKDKDKKESAPKALTVRPLELLNAPSVDLKGNYTIFYTYYS